MLWWSDQHLLILLLYALINCLSLPLVRRRTFGKEIREVLSSLIFNNVLNTFLAFPPCWSNMGKSGVHYFSSWINSKFKRLFNTINSRTLSCSFLLPCIVLTLSSFCTPAQISPFKLWCNVLVHLFSSPLHCWILYITSLSLTAL